MMPVVPAPIDASFDPGPESVVGFAIGGREGQRRELLADVARLTVENARLLEENHALREAATLWIRLYEKQLERANQATSASAPAEGAA